MNSNRDLSVIKGKKMVNKELVSCVVFFATIMLAGINSAFAAGFYSHTPVFSDQTYNGNQLSYVLIPPTFNIQYATSYDDYNAGLRSVKASIWVYKTTWNVDGTFNPSQSYDNNKKRYNPDNGYYEPTMQSCEECYDNPALTVNDIGKLEEVYEFPTHQIDPDKQYISVTNETWDGFSDPALTGGVKQPVRDCVFLVLQDAVTNKAIHIEEMVLQAFSRYDMNHGVNYTTDGKGNYSANIDVPIAQPVTHVYALLMSNECNIGTLTFSAVNKGTPYMVQYMNAKTPGNQQVLAYTELTNPVIDKDNPIIHSYTWKDMKWINMDGTQTNDPIYPTEDFPYFIMTIILETDDMTVTGIKDGVINAGPYIDMRKAQVITDITPVNPQLDSITINQTTHGFTANCPNNMYLTEYRCYGIDGRLVGQGTLSGQQATVTLPQAQKGMIIIQVMAKDKDTESSKTMTVKYLCSQK